MLCLFRNLPEKERKEKIMNPFLDDMKPKGKKRVNDIFETILFGSRRNRPVWHNATFTRARGYHHLAHKISPLPYWSNKEKRTANVYYYSTTRKLMIQNKAMAMWMLALTSLLAASPIASAKNNNSTMSTFPTVGDKVCIEGHVMVRKYLHIFTKSRHVMTCTHRWFHSNLHIYYLSGQDFYCIIRGTLLDNPSIRTLSPDGPLEHSVHCLIDGTYWHVRALGQTCKISGKSRCLILYIHLNVHSPSLRQFRLWNPPAY